MEILANRMRDLASRNVNFAYFCRFKDHDRLIGEEKLYTGKEAINLIKAETLDHVSVEVPVIVSFSYVNNIFENIKYSSEYPPLSYFIPDTAETGRYIRRNVFNPSPPSGFPSDHEFETEILHMRSLIKEGEMLQVVLSKEFGPFSIDPVERLLSFLENDRSMYVFYYRIGPYEVIGSSPENVITRNGKITMIEPIAGTRKISQDHMENLEIERNLLGDPKELLEHRMLVDLARNDLGKVSEYGTVKVVKSMEIRRFASVMHIVSRVESTLKEDATNSRILDAVFPAGTVSGAPKERAIYHIKRTEKMERGVYAGAVGIVSENAMDLALAIRTIYGRDGLYYTRAGAGIVKDSIPEREMDEIFMKAFSAAGGELYEITGCKQP